MPKELSINFIPTRRSARLELKRIKKDTELDSSEEPLKRSVILSAVSNRSAIVVHSNEPVIRAQQSEQISGANGSNNVETVPMDQQGEPIQIPKTALKFKQNSSASIFFGVSQQQGWETGGRRSEQAAINTHADMEDAYYVPYMANEKVHYPSDTPYTLFVLADGHGGSHASRHFCRMVPEAVQEVLCSNPLWSFKEQGDQQLFREKIREMFKKLDRDYLNAQMRKFSEWIRNGQSDPMPTDQGSTLLIVILFDGIAIICNLGDSKTVICKTMPQKSAGRVPLELAYQSTIQSPGHPNKAYHVYSNGGVFRREENEKIIKTKISPPNFPNDSSPSQLKMYSSLQKARIYRPPDFQNPFGLTNDISLNLGDTMGDLFFKLDPPLFPCEADVDFLIMESGVDYIGVMAPDGLWDHMNVKMPEFIRKLARYLGLLTSCEDSDYMVGESTDDERDGHRHKSKKCNPIPSDPMQNMLNGEQLHDLSGALCDRTKDTLDIFEKDQGRYDDCTVIAFSCKY
ncbi:11784_t:CDS:2 [Diversispora eburnea]|uniref:11784_t:CDS:1 n=1 Tax=Diversispora eburnea TaxID=1213867 RepID=A0A9N8ZQ83_9GLOM|nr:11784_t:CDS:2 [Diversispora eburnea]